MDLDLQAADDFVGEFVKYLGLEITEATGDRIVARWMAGAKHHQPYGIVHGGVHASVVETLGSIGASVWLGDKGKCVGVSNTTDFYRAVRDEWRSDEFPSLFLFIELLPFDVDVNVHPQKAEVRFRDPRLMDRLGETLRLALARARGEEAAPLRTTSSLPEAPFAWEGFDALDLTDKPVVSISGQWYL